MYIFFCKRYTEQPNQPNQPKEQPAPPTHTCSNSGHKLLWPPDPARATHPMAAGKAKAKAKAKAEALAKRPAGKFEVKIKKRLLKRPAGGGMAQVKLFFC